jgi:hemolysin III
MHGLGLAFALTAGPALVANAAEAGGAARVASAVIYIFAMTAMFSVSMVYNHFARPAWREALRRLDHAAIYLKIAGAYTPFGAVSLAGGAGPPLLAGIWSVALIGLTVKLTAPRRLELVSIGLYLGLGWAILLVAGEARASLDPQAQRLLLAGGLLYTAGVPFHLARRLPYRHAIWHGFVVLATASLWGAVWLELR